MPKSKFFCIATEGATVDNRVIERAWIEEMAASYDPATYTARINCEHIAGFSPDRPFNAYGSVMALEAREVALSINGKNEKRLALYAEIDANEQLVEINKAGQKLFTSCEINPNFAGAGKAYLVGLAVTDSPASLGTEVIKFARLSRPNLFTDAEGVEIDIPADTNGHNVAEAISAGFNRLLASLPGLRTPEADNKTAPESAPADQTPAFDMDAFAKGMSEVVAAAVQPALDAAAKAQNSVNDLTRKLEATETTGFSRSPATGGDTAFVTDC